MSKTLTIKQALEANLVLESLISSDKSDKFVLASATRIKLAMNRRKLRPAVEEFQTQNNDLVKKYGKADEKNPENITVQNGTDDYKAFILEQKGLLHSDAEVSLSPIKIADLGDNQIPIDLIDQLIEVGIVLESECDKSECCAAEAAK